MVEGLWDFKEKSGNKRFRQRTNLKTSLPLHRRETPRPKTSLLTRKTRLQLHSKQTIYFSIKPGMRQRSNTPNLLSTSKIRLQQCFSTKKHFSQCDWCGFWQSQKTSM